MCRLTFGSIGGGTPVEHQFESRLMAVFVMRKNLRNLDRVVGLTPLAPFWEPKIFVFSCIESIPKPESAGERGKFAWL
jgi:hypothetical protein